MGSDSLHEFLLLLNSTLHICRKRFVRAVCELFKSAYLHRLAEINATKIMKLQARLIFPGFLGSSDCSGCKLQCGAVAEQCRNIEREDPASYN